MSTSSVEAPTAGIRLSLSKATKNALSFSAGCLRNLLPGSAPISLQWFSLYVSFSNICKATTVTHPKRIYRNLLRKETSFVYYTSSVRWIIARRWEQNQAGDSSNSRLKSSRRFLLLISLVSQTVFLLKLFQVWKCIGNYRSLYVVLLNF